MIGDAVQTMFPEDGHYAARVDMKPPRGQPGAWASSSSSPSTTIISSAKSKKIKDRFNEIFQ